ncbi:MAG TPA: AMP-binding protein, partial [Mycobacterium sp.]|nr:AMP-binding protein [Mycobacterium sp.]
MSRHLLTQRIADVLDLEPGAHAIEYGGQWISWAQVAASAQRIAAITGGAEVGMLLRNRPGHVAAFLGVLLGGGTVVVINPSRGDERVKADIEALGRPIVGERDDLTALVAAGTPTVAISGLLDDADVSAPPAGGAASPSGVAVRMLTSGTTGPPKRIDLGYDMLARSVMGPDPDHAA